MTSLFDDKRLSKEDWTRMRKTMKQAKEEAARMIDDSRAELQVGETWNTGWLWQTAAEKVPIDPVFAAALLLELAEAEGLLVEEEKVEPKSDQERAAALLVVDEDGYSTMPVHKINYFDFGMGYMHDMPCAVYPDQSAVLSSQGNFQPSWKARAEGWKLVKLEPGERIVGPSWFSRMLSRIRNYRSKQ